MLVKRAHRAGGPPSSLLDLGYVHAGIDDGWQECASYTVEPSGAPAFHDASGKPIVNSTKFPDLKALSAYASSKGIALGWYENNCICHESGGHIRNQTWRDLSYAGDVAQLVENDFKGIKIDNCGLHNDMDHYSKLMNETGKAFLVERSDQGHGTPTNLSWCPFNLFRSSGDIRPNWGSLHHNLLTTQKYLNISRPGCWACKRFRDFWTSLPVHAWPYGEGCVYMTETLEQDPDMVCRRPSCAPDLKPDTSGGVDRSCRLATYRDPSPTWSQERTSVRLLHLPRSISVSARETGSAAMIRASVCAV